PGARIRAVLHHQGDRRGHRARPRRRARDRRRAWRLDRGRERGGEGEPVLDLPPAAGRAGGGGVVSGRVLVVDDEREMCEAIAAGLGPRGHEVRWETSAEAALALCERIVASRPDVPVVVITGVRKPRDGDRRDPRGAYDFITKPVKMDALAVALSRAVQHRSLREEVKRLRHLVGEAERFDELVGDSGPMRRVPQLLDRVIDSDASVLVTGESGTGKE